MMAFRTLRSKCALLAPVCLLVLGPAGNAAADTINVAWDPSGSTVGYKVHVGVQSGSYTNHFDAGSSTTFAFTSATAGQRYCFTVSAYTVPTNIEGPNSSEVCGYSNAPPTLVNPGTRTSTVGQSTALQLQGADPASQPLTYSATGLPPGLSVMSSTGYVSGTGTTAGTYSVTARASDGVLSTSQTFTWNMTTSTGGGGTTPPPPTGTDATPPTVTIGAPDHGIDVFRDAADDYPVWLRGRQSRRHAGGVDELGRRQWCCEWHHELDDCEPSASIRDERDFSDRAGRRRKCRYRHANSDTFDHVAAAIDRWGADAECPAARLEFNTTLLDVHVMVERGCVSERLEGQEHFQ